MYSCKCYNINSRYLGISLYAWEDKDEMVKNALLTKSVEYVKCTDEDNNYTWVETR